MKYYLSNVIFIVFLLIPTSHDVHGQSRELQEQIVIDLDEIKNNGTRTEIQRYTGYEELLTRYLTLPYDISANTAKQGRYFDIGFLLLALFPIALLTLTYRRKKIFYSSILLIILYIGLCFDTSFVNVDQQGAIEKRSDAWLDSNIFDNATIDQKLLIHIYDFTSTLAKPITKALEYFSSNQDHISYPILSLLCLGLILTTKLKFPQNGKLSTIFIVSIVFFFLWLFLSGGIIWYGLFVLIISLGLTFSLIKNHVGKNESIKNLLTIIVWATVVLWVVLSFGARISNISPLATDDAKGIDIVNPSLVFYTTGLHTANRSRANIYRNIGVALDQINRNDELIYQVGTSMTFEIKNSSKRCYQDNVLSNFHLLFSKYKKFDILDEMLKASKFKYIIVDLYTYTLDKTPEQSLVKKFQLFINSLHESKGLKLLATDRQLEIVKYSGDVFLLNHLFPKQDPSISKVNIKEHGSYAIFEIL